MAVIVVVLRSGASREALSASSVTMHGVPGLRLVLGGGRPAEWVALSEVESVRAVLQ